MVPFMVIAAVAALPCEYVIDYGPVPMTFKYKMRIDLVARDGTTDQLDIVWSANTDPEGNRTDTVILLKDLDWVARPGPGASLIVTGTKDGSAVKSVVVTSQAAVPTARWVPVINPPPKKK